MDGFMVCYEKRDEATELVWNGMEWNTVGFRSCETASRNGQAVLPTWWIVWVIWIPNHVMLCNSTGGRWFVRMLRFLR